MIHHFRHTHYCLLIRQIEQFIKCVCVCKKRDQDTKSLVYVSLAKETHEFAQSCPLWICCCHSSSFRAEELHGPNISPSTLIGSMYKLVQTRRRDAPESTSTFFSFDTNSDACLHKGSVCQNSHFAMTIACTYTFIIFEQRKYVLSKSLYERISIFLPLSPGGINCILLFQESSRWLIS